MSTLNELLLALKAAVENSDTTEFSRVVEALHRFPEDERGVVVQLINAFTEMYPYINWEDDIAEIEPQPRWILDRLPTKHRIELDTGLYRQLQLYFRSSRVPKSTTEKDIELLMDELLNKLLRDFLKAHNIEAKYRHLGTSQLGQ